ncbi:MAG: PilZ domain-containing protein [Treponema sp.]|nr:PilZ domain-containing protein [Treponema sp.]
MSDEAAPAITGKKIFFLYPTGSIQNQVISELGQQEYEVYAAKDHMRLLRALQKYEDAIVYINLDDKIPEPEWEKFIVTIQNTRPKVGIGIFTANNDEEVKNKYLDKLKITCGYFGLKHDMHKAPEKIIEYLEKMEAKGRRKYLRAALDREANTTINMPLNGEFINGVLRDISVVGFSCVFERDPNLAKNSLHKGIQIRLQSTLLNVDGVVFGSREEQGERIYVMIFTQRVESETRAKIRKYLMTNMQIKMDAEINQ